MHVNRKKLAAQQAAIQSRVPPGMIEAVANVGVAIAHGGDSILMRTMMAVVNMMVESAKNRIAVNIIPEQGCYVQRNRWAAAKKAVEHNMTHVLYVDTDMGFRPDALLRLLAHKKPIVGANYWTRSFPMYSTIKMPGTDGPTQETRSMNVEEIPTELFECFSVGTGLMLVDVRVFKALPQPWFQVTHQPDGSLQYGEDVWFCKHARDNGFSVWCDPNIEVEHLGIFEYKDHERWDADGIRNPANEGRIVAEATDHTENAETRAEVSV